MFYLKGKKPNKPTITIVIPITPKLDKRED